MRSLAIAWGARTVSLDEVLLQVMRPSLAVITLIVLVAIAAGSMVPAFDAIHNWSNMVNGMVVIALITLGSTVVLIGGGIDLSVGAIMGLTGGTMALLWNSNFTLPFAICAALVVGLVLGVVNGIVITVLGVTDFVATLAMLGIASGLLYLLTGGVPVGGFVTSSVNLVGGEIRWLGVLSVPIAVMAVVALVVGVMLRRTPLGVHIFAVGSDRSAALQAGVRVQWVRIATYAVSGLLAGIAGVVLASQLGSVDPSMGSGYELDAIAAAVIGGASLAGGRGGVIGALLGSLFLTMIDNVLSIMNVNVVWQGVVLGALVLLAVLVERSLRVMRVRVDTGPSMITRRKHLLVSEPVTKDNEENYDNKESYV